MDVHDARIHEVLLRAHGREVVGEALFHELSLLRIRETEQVALRTLARLEGQMRKAIELRLQRDGVAVDASEEDVAFGRDLAGGFADQAWPDVVASFYPSTEGALADYETAAEMSAVATGSGPDPVLRLLVDHTVALQQFVARVAAGDPDESEPVAAVVARLEVLIDAEAARPDGLARG